MSRGPTETIRDAQGRVIEIATLSVVDQYRLRKAIDPAQWSDPVSNSLATAAASVLSIDGHPMPMPQTPLQLEAMIARLDDAGWAAITAHLERKIKAAEAAAAALVGSDAGPLESSGASPNTPA